jgi:hypothetical protein
VLEVRIRKIESPKLHALLTLLHKGSGIWAENIFNTLQLFRRAFRGLEGPLE